MIKGFRSSCSQGVEAPPASESLKAATADVGERIIANRIAPQ
jgi:hypothetical protein